MRRLKIVQVISNIPDAGRIPPTNQGGTEKVVYELTEELVRRGHDVTIFAARGSRSSARLIPIPAGLRDEGIARFVLSRMPQGVDIIHDHTFSSALGRRQLRIPTVCTLHLPVKQRVKHPVYVSKRAQIVMGKSRGDYVYNGVKPSEYEFSSDKRSFLLFIGRILREKGILHAIEIAERTNKKLIIAGPIKDRELFRKEIAPRIRRNPRIHYVGPVGGSKKQLLLKRASCLLFPTLWEEPFGLVMIEAMACGTPVIALNNGAVSEVLAGFPQLICRSVPEMIRKVNVGKYPSPEVLRRYVTERFTTSKMTSKYIQIYLKAMRSR
ncbi:glycosyltransferase family 4 protein [Paenibacillus sedimenti]|uniref:Glycosyltransferase family 4 protein n=1 Tax=Paenibacillus sedimenti TaxID=2770274 RepID=A0A926QHY4_9BACL|nr:glycosyltransferase family 4 protein [Paenibacillus sedimenti]MBD0379033.1 glycosyltransferase family 4 protein [Paenibacillus sedimenti]